MTEADIIKKSMAEPWLIAPAQGDGKDHVVRDVDATIDHLRDQLSRKDALIHELVAALTEFLEFGEYAYSHGSEAIAKAKAAGYEP